MYSSSEFDDSDCSCSGHKSKDSSKLKVTHNDKGNVSQVFDKLNSFRQNAIFTDFSIKVQGAIIQCNKNILSAQSEYFETMFQSGMKESAEGELTLNDMSPKVVEDIINYFYHQAIVIDWENVMEYLDVAEMFLLKELKERIDGFISSHVDVDNCLEWYHTSKTYSLENTKDRLKWIIMSNYEKVSSSPVFNTLTYEDMEAIILHGHYVFSNQVQKLKTFVNWILKDKPNREKNFKNVMDHVIIRKCSPDYLHSLLEEFKDILENDEELHQKISVGRDIAKMESTNVAMIGKSQHDKIYQLDLYHNEYTERKIRPWPIVLSASNYFDEYRCVTPRGMFSIGYLGWSHYRGEGICRECSILCPSTCDGTDLPPLFESRNIFCVTHVGHDLYVFTRNGENEVIPRVLELHSEYWEAKSDYVLYLCEESSPVMWSIKKLLYVLTAKKKGGMKLRCLDTTIKQRSRRRPPPIQHLRGAKIVVAQDKSYIVGGEDSLCLRYEHSEDEWEDLAKPPGENEHGSAFYANGRIYLCGVLQSDNNKREHVMEEYDIATNCWKRSDLPAVPLKDGLCLPYKD